MVSEDVNSPRFYLETRRRIMEFELLNRALEEDLHFIKENSIDIVIENTKSIITCRKLLSKYYSYILKNGFQSQEDEIEFFRVHKQIPLSELVYHAEIKSFELQFPKVDKIEQLKRLRKKVAKLNKFFSFNIDFIQYIDNDYHHFDIQYFTREFFDIYPFFLSNHFYQDDHFSTARDLLLSKTLAYRKLLLYFETRMRDISYGQTITSFSVSPKNTLNWTSSKSALIELIYALYHSHAINNGKVEIKDIANTFQKMLGYKLGDFYKTFAEIKNRKKSRTKFLDELSTNLLIEMDKAEE